jgi:crotonobetainyl-CoA:carnitine CoA-transferase CaiB-like acyl-CoA transferase
MEGATSKEGSLEAELARLRAELEAERTLRRKLENELQEARGASTQPVVGTEPPVQQATDRGGKGLQRVRVLDLTRVLAGPFCSMLLADMGATVLKLEVPDTGDDSRQYPPFRNNRSLYYVNLNRGKKSIVINLKEAEGKRIFLDLVQHCDILIENFSPGTMERLGLGFDKLKELHPGLIYASISGFGQTGRYLSRPGYDIIAQGMSGLMSITGWPDSPPTRTGTAIGDITCALFTCVGILTALHEKNKTGKGQLVDVSLVDSLFATMGQHVQKIFIEDVQPTRIGNRYEFIYPYDSFKAADGWAIIGVANDMLWSRFVACTKGKKGVSPELSEEKFNTNVKRLEHHAELKRLIEEWTSQHTIEEIVNLLIENRIPACPIKDLTDVARDPHVAIDREMIVEIEQPEVGPIRLLGNPVKMSVTDPRPRGPAPELGQHTEEVLSQLLGLSPEQINELKAKKVLG